MINRYRIKLLVGVVIVCLVLHLEWLHFTGRNPENQSLDNDESLQIETKCPKNRSSDNDESLKIEARDPNSRSSDNDESLKIKARDSKRQSSDNDGLLKIEAKDPKRQLSANHELLQIEARDPKRQLSDNDAWVQIAARDPKSRSMDNDESLQIKASDPKSRSSNNDESLQIKARYPKSRSSDKDESLSIKARDPKYWEYGDGTCAVNPFRHIYRNILQRWIEMSTALNIDYMLAAGTLLGAWRNEDVIPWDYDQDIYVNRSDLPMLDRFKDSRGFRQWKNPRKVRLIMQEDWKKPYLTRRRFDCAGKQVTSYSKPCGFQEPVARLIGAEGKFMDMYEIWMENGKVYDYSDWEKYLPYDQLYPRRKCKYMGLTMYCPKNPLAILDPFYANGNMSNLQPFYICQNKEWVKAKLY